jgi:hypothetical protein
MKVKLRQTTDGFLFFNEILFLFFKRFFTKKFKKNTDSWRGMEQILRQELATL